MAPTPLGQKPRRAHVKSRSGCQRCKIRKVKCGEERPTCRNCQRRGEACERANSDEPIPGTGTANLNVPAGPSRSQAQAQAQARAPSLEQTVLPSRPNDSIEPLNLSILDLELLHHYCTSTCLTISSDPATRNWFLVSVPQLGFSSPYVLYSLLALAACHLAHFRPESRHYYYARAKALHATATAVAAPLLSDISIPNIAPMYSFSIMTLYISFASLRDEHGFPFEENGLVPNWLALFRGVRTVLESNNRAIYSSSIAFLFTNNSINETWDANQADFEPMLELQDHLEASTSESEETLQVLLNAFSDLRRAFYFFYGEEHGNEIKIRSLFQWMYKATDEFIALIQNRNNKALCILAFFCVLLHRFEYNWFFQGWGIHLIDRIHRNLDEVHRFLIRWPIQQIGWIPQRDTYIPYYSNTHQ